MSITRSQIARQMYADGALVDPRMANTLEQNKAINNANAQINQAMRSSGGLKSLYDQYGISDADRSRLSGGMASRNMILQNSHREELVKQLAGLQNQNVVYSSKPPTDMFGILISDHNKYGVGSDPTKVSETDMNAFRQRVLDSQKNYYQKELDLINQDYISSGYPDQAMTLEEYMRSIGAYAKGGRAGYAYGGRGYSDYASPSSTTASQDFATQAVSGGQTDYGGGDNQGPITPRLPDPNIRKKQVKDFILGGAYAFARATFFPYNLIRSAQGISSVLNKAGLTKRDYLALENLINQQQTGFNPNASPTSSTAGLTYGQMRTGGTFDITNTGGDNQPIIPRIPMVTEAPTDVDGTLSDLDIYIQNLRAAQPNPFMLDSRFAAAQGGVARQAYGLGSLVRKITKPIKKILKSDVGKAALAGAAIYGLGGGKFFGKNLPGLSPTNKSSFDLKNILPNLFGYGYEEKENMYEGLLGKAGLTKGYGEKGLTGIGKAALIAGPSALAYFTTPEEEEEDLSGITSREDTSGLRQLIARYPELRFQVQPQYQLAANGGRMGYEEGGNINPADLPMSKEGFPTYEDIETKEEVDYPYENKEMASEPNIDAELFQMYLDAIGSGKIPRSTTFDQYKELMGETASMGPERTMANEGGLMNLGGKEMDLRGGGFVPLGAKEKADDVPARLSKNEFVFTADAVRAAGGGDVDRGADLMYKTMKDLESRVG